MEINKTNMQSFVSYSLIGSELGPNTNSGFYLSYAVKGHSGYTFGKTQNDINTNPKAKKIFEEAINNNPNISEDDKKNIISLAEYTPNKKSFNILTQKYGPKINESLSTPYISKKIQEMDAYNINFASTQTENVIQALKNANLDNHIFDDLSNKEAQTAIAEMAEWCNQTHGLSVMAGLTQSTQSESLITFLKNKGSVFSGKLLDQYLAKQYYFTNQDGNFPQWKINQKEAAQKAAASMKIQVGYNDPTQKGNFLQNILNYLNPIGTAHADTLDLATNAGYLRKAQYAIGATQKTLDPILIDLSKTGSLDLNPLSSTSPLVDLSQSGKATMTAWFGTDVGVLVLRNPTTGTWSVVGGNGNGWSALATLVQDGQPTISAADAVYANLGIWTDTSATLDGVITDGTVQSLADAGVSSINLTAENTSTVDDISGDKIEQTSSLTYTDGSTSLIASVELKQNPIVTKITDNTPVSAEITALPDLQGYGNLESLHAAMTHSTALTDDVKTLASLPAGTNYQTYIQDVGAIMYAWAGITGTAQTNPTSPDDAMYQFFNSYMGETLTYSQGQQARPDGYVANSLSDAWFNLETGIAARLLLQGPLSGLQTDFTYDPDTDSIFPVYGLTASLTDLQTQYGAFSAATADTWRTLGLIINSYKADYNLDDIDFGDVTASAIGSSAATYLSATSQNLSTTVDSAGTMHISGGTPEGGTSLYIADKSSTDIAIENQASSTPYTDNILCYSSALTPSDVTVSFSGSDMILQTTDGTKTILRNQALNSYAGNLITITNHENDNTYEINRSEKYGVQNIAFGTGTFWTNTSEEATTSEDTHLVGLAPEMTYTPGGYATLIDAMGNQNTFIIGSTDTALTINTHGGTGTLTLTEIATAADISEARGTDGSQIITIKGASTQTITATGSDTETPITGITLSDGSVVDLTSGTDTTITLADNTVTQGSLQAKTYVLASGDTVYENGLKTDFTITPDTKSATLVLNGGQTTLNFTADNLKISDFRKQQNPDGSFNLIQKTGQTIKILNPVNPVSITGVNGVSNLTDIPTIATEDSNGTIIADTAGNWSITATQTTQNIILARNSQSEIDLTAANPNTYPTIQANDSATYDLKFGKGWSEANTEILSTNTTSLVFRNTTTGQTLTLLNALPQTETGIPLMPASSITFADNTTLDLSGQTLIQNQTGIADINDTGTTKEEDIIVSGSQSVITGYQFSATELVPTHNMTVTINGSGNYTVVGTNSDNTTVNLNQNFGTLTYTPKSTSQNTIFWQNVDPNTAIYTLNASGDLTVSENGNRLILKGLYDTQTGSENYNPSVYAEENGNDYKIPLINTTISNFSDLTTGNIIPTGMSSNIFNLQQKTGTAYAAANSSDNTWNVAAGTHTIYENPAEGTINALSENNTLTLNESLTGTHTTTLNVSDQIDLGNITATWDEATGNIILGLSDGSKITENNPFSMSNGFLSENLKFISNSSGTKDIGDLVEQAANLHTLASSDTAPEEIGIAGGTNIFNVDDTTKSVTSTARNNLIYDSQTQRQNTTISLPDNANNQMILVAQSPGEIWLEQSGNDLKIIDTDSWNPSSITLLNDFASGSSALKTLTINGSGLTLNETGINAFCAATKDYLTSNPGYNPTTSGMPSDDTGILAAQKDWTLPGVYS